MNLFLVKRHEVNGMPQVLQGLTEGSLLVTDVVSLLVVELA
jgi:hypothetical protein